MAKYLQIEPPMPPEMSLEQMKATWKVLVAARRAPDQARRPSATGKTTSSSPCATPGRWRSSTAIPMRSSTRSTRGYAVHITRMSATGRYAYVIGRDGKLALVDLWMEKPDKVAEVQTCYDARSVEVSKYKGEEGDFTDKYAVVGCYWPPHFAILDGQTLEPFKIVSTRSYTFDTEEYHPEPRVASILASHFKPEWIVNIKETGQIWIVNYTDPINPTIKMIEAARFLHDGGLDSTKRYFLVAANQSNQIAVVDAQEGKLEALVDTPAMSRTPGAGPTGSTREFGPVWSTAHLGEAGHRFHRHRPRGAPRRTPGKPCASPPCPARAACSSRPIPTASGSGWT